VEFKIISERQNPLMKRREIQIEIKYGGATPGKAHVQEHIAAKLSVEPESVEVVKILSEHGKSAGKAWLKIWEEKKIALYSQAKSEIKAESAKAEEKK
jgi:small subunit ribosomal protein S24e